MELRKTAFFDIHEELGAKMIDYAGWALPSEYEGLVAEHNAVRENVGLFDVSHMGEFYFEGPDALKFANYIFSNNIDNVEDGQCQYTLLLNDHGGVVDDLILAKINDEKIFMVVNGANVEKDYEWITARTEGFDVKVINDTDKFSVIAVQGPNAPKVVQALTDYNLDDLGYYHMVEDIEITGKKANISNSGYTGEVGYEIYTAWDDGPAVWKALMDEGAVPCGLGCRDTLRFEAAMPLYGNEMDEDHSPIEAGLKFAIKFDKGDFVGKEALEKEIEEGQKKKIIGLELKGKGIPRQGYKILKDGKEIGEITTGYLSPTLGKPLANVIIDTEEAVEGNEVEVQIRKKTVPAVLVGRRFLQNK